MKQNYFTQDFYKFFRDLAANNNREWFNDHKKRYETSVKLPFEDFVSDLIKEASKENPNLNQDPKKAIFRIYRDIRFSKDKTPYKLHMAAAISEGGRKDPSKPGFYIQMGGEDFRYYSGLYQPSKEDLYKIRNHISQSIPEFQKAYNEKGFKESFGEIRGEKNKIIPKEFKEAAQEEPLLFNKAFYFFHSKTIETALNEDLMNIIFDLHRKSQSLRTYLQNALK